MARLRLFFCVESPNYLKPLGALVVVQIITFWVTQYILPKQAVPIWTSMTLSTRQIISLDSECALPRRFAVSSGLRCDPTVFLSMERIPKMHHWSVMEILIESILLHVPNCIETAIPSIPKSGLQSTFQAFERVRWGSHHKACSSTHPRGKSNGFGWEHTVRRPRIALNDGHPKSTILLNYQACNDDMFAWWGNSGSWRAFHGPGESQGNCIASGVQSSGSALWN